MKKCAFSTGTMSYIPFIKTLAKSFKKYHPDWDFYYFILDYNDENIKGTEDFFISKSIACLSIPNLSSFLMKYDLLEASTGVKPFCFSYLFDKLGYKYVTFFDADIKVFSSMEETFKELENASMILVPHMLSPINEDGKTVSNLGISLAGSYNLGFTAMKNCNDSCIFLKFWKEMLEKHCYLDVHNGTQVDQKWCEFAPSFINGVKILKDIGLDVSYWNLHERKVVRKGINLYVSDSTVKNSKLKPLKFYHFSGIDFSDPSIFSKHQNRIVMSDQGPTMKGLFSEYMNDVKIS